MADTSNLSKFLSDIAEAIRTKKETIDTIPAKDFDTEILSIETGINTADATATADNIENGYTAYVNGKKVSGTIMTSLDTIITAGADATITDTGTALNVDRGYGKKLILKSEQQLRSSIPYATIANIAGLTPEKLMKGETVLGVEGTAEGGGPIEYSDNAKCHIFYSEEEAQAFTGYQPGDKAIVYGVGEEPFSLNFEKTPIDVGMNTSTYFDNFNFSFSVFEKVVLPEPMTFDDGFTWDTKDGKTVTNKIWLKLTETSCVITVGGFTSSINTTNTYEYTSTDGLTYTLNGKYNGTTKQYQLPTQVMADKYDIFREKMEYCWPVIGDIYSKFLCFPNRRILKKIYTYEPIVNASSSVSLTDNVYCIDLQKTAFVPEKTVIVPYGPILVQDIQNIFSKIGLTTGGIIFTDTDVVYVCNNEMRLWYDVDSDRKFAVTAGEHENTTISSVKLYEYNLTSGTYTTISLTGRKYGSSEADTTYNLECMDLRDMRSMFSYTITTNSDTGVTTYNIVPLPIHFVDISGTVYTNVATPMYCQAGKNISLKNDYLGLRGSANDVRHGASAFINEYVEGVFESGNIGLDEETEINAVLDEILGGE